MPPVAANNENLCAAASKLIIMLNMAARYHNSGSLNCSRVKWFSLAPFRLPCTSNAPTVWGLVARKGLLTTRSIFCIPINKGLGRPSMRTDQRASARQGIPHDKNVDGGILAVRLQNISFRYFFNLNNMEPFLASICLLM